MEQAGRSSEGLRLWPNINIGLAPGCFAHQACSGSGLFESLPWSLGSCFFKPTEVELIDIGWIDWTTNIYK